MATAIHRLLIRTVSEQIIISQATSLFISLIIITASCKVFWLCHALQMWPDQETRWCQCGWRAGLCVQLWHLESWWHLSARLVLYTNDLQQPFFVARSKRDSAVQIIWVSPLRYCSFPSQHTLCKRSLITQSGRAAPSWGKAPTYLLLFIDWALQSNTFCMLKNKTTLKNKKIRESRKVWRGSISPM